MWSSGLRPIRDPWLAILRSTLTEVGTPEAQVPALADLIVDTLDGLPLSRLTGTDPGQTDAVVDVFADLLK